MRSYSNNSDQLPCMEYEQPPKAARYTCSIPRAFALSKIFLFPQFLIVLALLIWSGVMLENSNILFIESSIRVSTAKGLHPLFLIFHSMRSMSFFLVLRNILCRNQKVLLRYG